MWESYLKDDVVKFIITTKSNNRDHYFLYEVTEEGKLYKLGKSKDPEELEDKYRVYEKIQ